MTRVLKPFDLQALSIFLCIKVALVTETARGDGYFYECMFRNANYQVFGEGITDEYIETYRHWDDEAIPSAMLCVDDIPRPEYEHIWDDYYADGYYPLVDPPVPGT